MDMEDLFAPVHDAAKQAAPTRESNGWLSHASYCALCRAMEGYEP